MGVGVEVVGAAAAAAATRTRIDIPECLGLAPAGELGRQPGTSRLRVCVCVCMCVCARASQAGSASLHSGSLTNQLFVACKDNGSI